MDKDQRRLVANAALAGAAVLMFLLGAGVGRRTAEPTAHPAAIAFPNATIDCRFSPRGGCTAEVVRAVNAAQNSVLVASYQMRSQPIEDALKAAARRGVKVECVLDRGQAEHAKDLAGAGADVRIDRHHQIFHSKVCIVDGCTLLTGSFNYSHQAEAGNAENLLVIVHSEAVRRHVEFFRQHQEHADPLTP